MSAVFFSSLNGLRKCFDFTRSTKCVPSSRELGPEATAKSRTQAFWRIETQRECVLCLNESKVVKRQNKVVFFLLPLQL